MYSECVQEGFATLSKDIHDNAVKHGFWKHRDVREMATKIALAHSELSEALEALRHSYPKSDKIPFGNFEEELADCVIRILDLAYVHKVDLYSAILAKHSYNKTRLYKHGGKKC